MPVSPVAGDPFESPQKTKGASSQVAELVNPYAERAKKLFAPLDTHTCICDNLARVYEIVSINTE